MIFSFFPVEIYRIWRNLQNSHKIQFDMESFYLFLWGKDMHKSVFMCSGHKKFFVAAAFPFRAASGAER